jgi:hypothetical protein
MDNSAKTAMKYIIIFSIVILIGLGSIVSMFIYSLSDRGTPSDEPIELENATVQLYQSIGGNYIKLDFYNVTEEKTQQYDVILIDENGKEIEKMRVTIDLKPENMEEYIYEAKIYIENICFYKVVPVN